MKKALKIFVLLLSLALIFGAIAVVASADDAVTVRDISNADVTGDTLTLYSNANLTETIKVKSDLTVNLNGYTLTSENEIAFDLSEATENITFTINGGGKINFANMFIDCNAPQAVTVNINGNSGAAITMTQNTGATSLTAIKVNNGTVNVSDVIYSAAPVYNSNATAIFMSGNNASQDGVVWNLTNVDVECTTALSDVYYDPAYYSGTPYCNTFMYVSGKKGAANITDCNIRFVGKVFEVGTARAGGNIINAKNSVLDSSTNTSLRAYFINGKGTGVAYFDNCTVISGFTVLCTAWGDDQTGNDTMSLYFKDSLIRPEGVRTTAASAVGGSLATNCDVTLDNSSLYGLRGASNTDRGGNLFVKVGSRISLSGGWGTSNRVVYVDTDGTYLSTTTEVDVVRNNGSTSGKRLNVTASTIKLVYDPIGDPLCPYVVVKDTDTTADVLWTSASLKSYLNFEWTGKTQTHQEDLRYTSTYVDGVLQGSTSTKKTVYSIGTWEDSMWWNKHGNYAVVADNDNTYFKWYVPANPDNPDQVVVAIKGKAPNLSTAPTLKSKYSAGNKVFVHEMSFGTASHYPDGTNISLHVRTEKGGGVAVGNFTIKNNKLTPDGSHIKLVDGVTDEDLTVSDFKWNHITVVAYVDKAYGANYNIGAGIGYWFLNGKLIATQTGLANAGTHTDYDIVGLRTDMNGELHVGDSMIFDNWSCRYYSEPIAPGENITEYAEDGTVSKAAAHKPEYYAAFDPSFIERYTQKPNITVSNKGYANVTEAIADNADNNFGVVLHRDVEELISADVAKKIYTNGYNLIAIAGSASPFLDYGLASKEFATYAPDGKRDVDGSGNIVVTIDPTKTLTFGYFNGNPNYADEIADTANYTLIEKYVGESFAEPYAKNELFSKSGQTLYGSKQNGWADYKTNAAVPTYAIYEEFYLTNAGAVNYYKPTFAAPTAVAASVNLIMVDVNGYIRDRFTNAGGFWSGSSSTPVSVWGINAQYGESLYINKDTIFKGGLSLYPRGGTNYYGKDFYNTPAEDKIFYFDLNGYKVTYDPSDGDHDYSTFIQVNVGDNLNLYSSVEGGVIEMKGTLVKDGVDIANCAYIVNQSFRYTDDPAKKEYDAHASSKTELYSFLQSDTGVNLDTAVNIGTAADTFGNVHNGSNLTLYCDGIIWSSYSNAAAVTNIDGVKIYKTGQWNALLAFGGYNGTVNLTNFEIIGGAPDKNTNDALVWGQSHANYVGTGYKAQATVNIHKGTFFTAHSGQWIMVGGAESVFKKIHFEDFVGNVSIMGLDGNHDGVYVGKNVQATIFVPPVDNRVNYQVKLDPGVTIVRSDYTYPEFTTQYLVPKHTSTNEKGNKFYSFSYVETVAESMTLGWKTVATEDAVKVTLKGIDGKSYSFDYEKGKPVEKDHFSSAFNTVIDLETVKITAPGTVNGGKILPLTANENMDLVADTSIVNDVTGVLMNLSLYSSCTVNVYVPVSLKQYITALTVGGVIYDVNTLSTTTNEGVEYLCIKVTKNASQIGENVDIEIIFNEKGYETTFKASQSILTYAETIIAGNYTDAEKTLMKYIIAYGKATNDFFKLANEAIDKAVASGKYSVDGYGAEYSDIPEDVKSQLSKVFASVYVDLNGASPVFVFKVKSDFAGTVIVGGKSYDVTAGQKIVISDLRAYNFLDAITVVCEAAEVDTAFSFEYYAKYQQGGAAESIVNALYDYCYASQLYKLSLEATE